MDLVTNGMEFIISISAVASVPPRRPGASPESGEERKKERERERGGQSKEKAERRVEELSVLRTRLYLSNWYPAALGPPRHPFSWPRHLHTRNKSNNKIIIACGNASYLSLPIVYQRQVSLF